MPDGKATMGEVAKFFGMKLAEFRDEWVNAKNARTGEPMAPLSVKDKEELQKGIGDGTLSY